jgi:hypothetical protein
MRKNYLFTKQRVESSKIVQVGIMPEKEQKTRVT